MATGTLEKEVEVFFNGRCRRANDPQMRRSFSYFKMMIYMDPEGNFRGVMEDEYGPAFVKGEIKNYNMIFLKRHFPGVKKPYWVYEPSIYKGIQTEGMGSMPLLNKAFSGWWDDLSLACMGDEEIKDLWGVFKTHDVRQLPNYFEIKEVEKKFAGFADPHLSFMDTLSRSARH